MKWELRKENILIGTLNFRTADQPWFICDFEPTIEFEQFRSAFDAWAKIVNNPEPAEATTDPLIYFEEHIESLGLSIVPIDDATECTNYLLHVYDGKEAWLRCW